MRVGGKYKEKLLMGNFANFDFRSEIRILAKMTGDRSCALGTGPNIELFSCSCRWLHLDFNLCLAKV